MKIDWKRTANARIDIYPLILASLIIGWLFSTPFWVKFGLALIWFKFLDVCIDIGISTYEHFKEKKM